MLQRLAFWRSFLIGSAGLTVLCSFSPCWSRDPLLTNHVTTEDPGRVRMTALQPESTCSFKDHIFCGNLKFDDDSDPFLKDVSAMPLANGATSVKVGVVRYNMSLGGSWKIPFSLLSANVAGTADQSKVNALKLLDPDQGNINLKWTYAGRYHFGPFCDFEQAGKGICSVGLNAGFRYLGLEKSTGQTSTTSQGAHGFYLELANTFMFPIFQASDGKDAGQLAIKLSAARYQQSAGDSTLFPNARDASGNPLKLDKSYGGYALVAKLSITDKLGVEANHFRASANDSPIASSTTFSVSYELK
jgi:hypothetical protein